MEMNEQNGLQLPWRRQVMDNISIYIKYILPIIWFLVQIGYLWSIFQLYYLHSLYPRCADICLWHVFWHILGEAYKGGKSPGWMWQKGTTCNWTGFGVNSHRAIHHNLLWFAFCLCHQLAMGPWGHQYLYVLHPQASYGDSSISLHFFSPRMICESTYNPSTKENCKGTNILTIKRHIWVPWKHDGWKTAFSLKWSSLESLQGSSC